MGLLDWLTDGSLGNMGMGAGGANPPAPDMPPVQQTGSDGPPLPPTPAAVPPGLDAAPTPSGQPPAPVAPPPDPTPAAGPPDPPVNPATSDIGGGMQGGGPTPPPVPMPQPRPPGADAAPPTPPPAPPGAPTSLAPTNPGPSAPAPAPYQLGDQTALGRALGINPKSQSFNSALTGFGSGLTAAGNSKGKSPFQALTSGAGASIEGSAKEDHAHAKDQAAYLTAATAAQKAGDTAGYNTNMMQYNMGKLKLEQQKAASADAAGVTNKNDTPTQLFITAQRNVANDPLVKAAQNGLTAATKAGNGPTDPTVIAAQANLQKVTQEQTQYHLAGVGLHPQTAAQLAQQPGNTQQNPVKTGISTPVDFSTKMQVGQYYTDPKSGQLMVVTQAGLDKAKAQAAKSMKTSAPEATPSATADDDKDAAAAAAKKKADAEDDE